MAKSADALARATASSAAPTSRSAAMSRVLARSIVSAAFSASMSSGRGARSASMRVTESRIPGRGYCFLAIKRLLRLSGGLGTPGLLGISPVNRLQQIAHLCRSQRHRAIHSLWPNKTSSIQAFRIERQADAIMPNRFYQRSTAASENENIAGERVSAEPLLHLQSEAPHTPAHVGMTR